MSAEWFGKLPLAWRAVAIGRHVRFRNGADYSEIEVDEGGYPVYGSGGAFRRASSFMFDGKSVLFGRKGTVDRPLFVDERFWAVDTMYYTEIDQLRLVPKYLYYCATQLPYGRWLTSTALPSMTQSDLSSAKIPLPPVDVQARIAAFLDRETAEVDAFIADQQQLIALLTERRDAVWEEAIDTSRPEPLPLRRLISSIIDGPFGSALTSAHYSRSGTRVIRLGNIGVNEFKDDDLAYIPDEYAAELGAYSVEPGDVVVAGLGDERMPLGRAAVVPDIGPAIVKADCYRVRPNQLVSAEYLSWGLSAPSSRAKLLLLARGSTRVRLNTSVVRDVQVPWVPADRQAAALVAFSSAARELDAAMVDAREAIALSKERRSALISAAVTGRIDAGV